MREEGSHVAEAGEDEGHPAPPRHMEGVCGDTGDVGTLTAMP